MRSRVARNSFMAAMLRANAAIIAEIETMIAGIQKTFSSHPSVSTPASTARAPRASSATQVVRNDTTAMPMTTPT